MALNSYLTLRGDKTGDIKGSVIETGREGTIMVIACSHDLISPRDAASGLPTGKPMHKPMLITKELDKSSPLLYNAMVTNEQLTAWELKFFRKSSTGTEEHHFAIRLTNANIASIALRMPNTRNPDLVALETFEDVTFTYRKIKWTWLEGGITAEHEWEAATS